MYIGSWLPTQIPILFAIAPQLLLIFFYISTNPRNPFKPADGFPGGIQDKVRSDPDIRYIETLWKYKQLAHIVSMFMIKDTDS